MRPSPRARLSLDTLEDRCCPSISAHVLGGSLFVGGSSAQVTVTEVAQDQFRVRDGVTVVGTYHVEHNVQLDLTTHNSDQLALDLGGHIAPGNVLVNLGQGRPILSIFNGTIAGNLTVEGGGSHGDVDLGTDFTTLIPQAIPTPIPPPDDPNLPPGPLPVPVGLPAPGPRLEVGGDTSIYQDGSALGSLFVAAWAKLDGSLTTAGVGRATLSIASLVGKDAAFTGGAGGTLAEVFGHIAGSMTQNAGAHLDRLDLSWSGSVGGDVNTNGLSTVVLQNGSTVGGRAVLTAGDYGSDVDIGGSINKDLVVIGGRGADVLDVRRTGVINRDLWAWLGGGDNSVVLRGIVRGDVNLFSGPGDDTVSLGGLVAGNALFNLGDGDNKFILAGVGKVEGSLEVFTGWGQDSVGFSGQAVVQRDLVVVLGAGNDEASFADGFQVGWGVINGAAGADGFDGVPPPTIHLVNFEFGVA
jgi:hypothetical protein